MWAKIMRDRFEAKNLRSWWLRFPHPKQQAVLLPHSSHIITSLRTTMEALAAVLGGTSLFIPILLDEVLCLPSEHAVEIALRTQQILAEETG